MREREIVEEVYSKRGDEGWGLNQQPSQTLKSTFSQSHFFAVPPRTVYKINMFSYEKFSSLFLKLSHFLARFLSHLINYSWKFLFPSAATIWRFFTLHFPPPTTNEKTSNHGEKLFLSHTIRFLSLFFFLYVRLPIACCFRYDFFNYVLTSGSKSNMAQFFVQFSGFFDSEPLRIHTNCQQATYVKYNYCLFTIFRKSWKLFCTRTSLANSGPLFATTQQPKMCTHNKKAFDWLLLSFGFFFRWRLCKNSLAMFQRIFQSKIYFSCHPPKAVVRRLRNRCEMVFEHLLYEYTRRKLLLRFVAFILAFAFYLALIQSTLLHTVIHPLCDFIQLPSYIDGSRRLTHSYNRNILICCWISFICVGYKNIAQCTGRKDERVSLTSRFSVFFFFSPLSCKTLERE